MIIYIRGNKVFHHLMSFVFSAILLLYSSIGLAEVFSVNIKIDVIQKSCDVYGDLGITFLLKLILVK